MQNLKSLRKSRVSRGPEHPPCGFRFANFLLQPLQLLDGVSPPCHKSDRQCIPVAKAMACTRSSGLSGKMAKPMYLQCRRTSFSTQAVQREDLQHASRQQACWMMVCKGLGTSPLLRGPSTDSSDRL